MWSRYTADGKACAPSWVLRLGDWEKKIETVWNDTSLIDQICPWYPKEISFQIKIACIFFQHQEMLDTWQFSVSVVPFITNIRQCRVPFAFTSVQLSAVHYCLYKFIALICVCHWVLVAFERRTQRLKDILTITMINIFICGIELTSPWVLHEICLNWISVSDDSFEGRIDISSSLNIRHPVLIRRARRSSLTFWH